MSNLNDHEHLYKVCQCTGLLDERQLFIWTWMWSYWPCHQMFRRNFLIIKIKKKGGIFWKSSYWRNTNCKWMMD